MASPSVLAEATLEGVVDASLAAALAESDAAGGALEPLTDFIMAHADESLLLSGVAMLPILDEKGARGIADAVRPLLGLGGEGVGSMHNNGTDLAALAPGLLLGLRRVLARLFAALYSPPGSPVELVLEHSAHAIGYGTGATRERALAIHVDDSTYTASLCFNMSASCVGTELRFSGAQPVPGLPALARHQRLGHSDELAARPRTGWALLHRGCHPHRTTRIEVGERISAVLWYNPVRLGVSAVTGAGRQDDQEYE